MNQWEHSGASHGKQRHGFGETIDRVTPVLLEQKKDGGDQGSGVADTNPPYEIDDCKSPAYGNVDAPDPCATEEQVGDGKPQHVQQSERDQEADQPAESDRP